MPLHHRLPQSTSSTLSIQLPEIQGYGQPIAATSSRLLPTAQIIAQGRWPQLTAQLHTKSTYLAPVVVQPVPGPQLIVQLAGTIRMDLTQQGKRRSYQSQPGSVHFNTPQQLPYELTWQGPVGDAVSTIQLDLEADLLRQTAAAAGLDADHLELLAAPCLEAPLLQQLGYSLAALLQAPGPADTLYVETAAHMLAAQLVYQHSGQRQAVPAGRGGLGSERLRQIREYVQASLQQTITLESLAALACVSPFHFCRLFKQSTGLSPHQYVVGQRMQRAEHLLRHTRLSVAQVAHEVGYRNAGHFARLFQRHMGRLPTAVFRGHA